MIITSSANKKFKHARRVREGREDGLIFVEGERLAEECVRSGLTIEACFHQVESTPRTQALLGKLTIPLHPTDDDLMRELADTVNTQGIILIAHRPVGQLADIFRGDAPLIVALDRGQDPGNFGTLVRTAEAAGASGLIALPGAADAFSPKALRSSMGSAFRLPIVSATDAEMLEACKQHGISPIVATGEAKLEHYDYDWRQPTLLLLGNEARGVSPELMAQCRNRVRIPLHGGVESLNVAAAGAVMLFEAVRQRRQ